MLLKSLRLKDFRQFKGEQYVRFATDEIKNVSIIMGQNGSGKTSLAQSFTWCLYGKTDFDDPILLSKATGQEMLPGDEEKVRVELALIHNGTEYTIISEQKYSKGQDGRIKPIGQRKFAIAYKSKDGQQEFVPDLQTEMRMKEILPVELSKYFFFDGERIGNMSKELKKGKSHEFSDAVQSLLGLSAFKAAMTHLRGKGSAKSVIRNYDSDFDSSSDSRISELMTQIDGLSENIERIKIRKAEIDHEEDFVTERKNHLNEELFQNSSSRNLADDREKMTRKKKRLLEERNSKTAELLKEFNKNATAYFSKKLMHDSLVQLSESKKLDKGIPDIHARTIEHILKNGRCICGTEVIEGSEAYNELMDLFNYIPPQSLGNLIESFRRECEYSVKNSESFYSDFREKYTQILNNEEDIYNEEESIDDITTKLKSMKDTGKIQNELSEYNKQSQNLTEERSKLDNELGARTSDKERIENERQQLTHKDKNNKKIEIYKAYAQYLFDTLSEQYKTEEERVRNNLEEAVDEIFRVIYNGGFSLKLDEKYNIQIVVNDYNGFNEDIETSTAQSISIIFAFIAGVIKMARDSNDPDKDMFVSEAYPLVMDAPLSAFDKTRIESVSNVLPEIAEQVIIFIKDTDGEIAEQHLIDRIGSYAIFEKINEIETNIIERS